MCIYAIVWVCAHPCRYHQRTEVLDPLELELHAVVSSLAQMLGPLVERAVHALGL